MKTWQCKTEKAFQPASSSYCTVLVFTLPLLWLCLLSKCVACFQTCSIWPTSGSRSRSHLSVGTTSTRWRQCRKARAELWTSGPALQIEQKGSCKVSSMWFLLKWIEERSRPAAARCLAVQQRKTWESAGQSLIGCFKITWMKKRCIKSCDFCIQCRSS